MRFRAKEFAVQHSTNVVIYENENAERDYLSEAEAKEKGIKPIEILTKYKPVE